MYPEYLINCIVLYCIVDLSRRRKYSKNYLVNALKGQDRCFKESRLWLTAKTMTYDYLAFNGPEKMQL